MCKKLNIDLYTILSGSCALGRENVSNNLQNNRHQEVLNTQTKRGTIRDESNCFCKWKEKKREKEKINKYDFWGLVSQELPGLYVKDISTVELVWFIEDSTELHIHK